MRLKMIGKYIISCSFKSEKLKWSGLSFYSIIHLLGITLAMEETGLTRAVLETNSPQLTLRKAAQAL
ncbi:unnamed protein product [Blepharisma stoltei]|uniref:Uncharacterized protein n=1 Tax=Blepharisma stoltei TaxID=1481888 RepID=A0AAU9JAC4_9CILI|nr:unnamed protein product [Blepharisma stoltei]